MSISNRSLLAQDIRGWDSMSAFGGKADMPTHFAYSKRITELRTGFEVPQGRLAKKVQSVSEFEALMPPWAASNVTKLGFIAAIG